ncbi:isochorismatase family protein [Bernardetia sp.]|uniref:isochorismatase family protein n=1 Tax=Bernardetia sp. TaxID=1937974 RepID=UPI0025C1DB5A|nr:isochorismatase family protein [Bernardetia sp.]
MENKNALLIIDAQYDFCNPDGALYVQDAEHDIERLSDFITKNATELNHICVTLDSHPVNDISHPSFWRDRDGNPPNPFTQITLKEVEEGKWIPNFYENETKEYLKKLEAQGEFPHFIWTHHCLIGSKGAALDETLSEALQKWITINKEQGKYKQYKAVTKGTYPLTEHFGIFQAQIPVSNRPETQLNQSLLDSLNQYENVYLAGQAKSHCVATSLKQILDNAPELAKKVIVLEDCMSDIPNMGHLGEPIYKRAKKMGVQFKKSNNV